MLSSLAAATATKLPLHFSRLVASSARAVVCAAAHTGHASAPLRAWRNPSPQRSLPLSWRRMSTSEPPVFTEVREDVGVITISRRKALNALNQEVMRSVVHAAEHFDGQKGVKVIIITGAGDKAFACGADIKEMAPKTYPEVHREKMFDPWDRLRDIRKPMVGAVNGYALGGGCELAMMCDVIIASDTASFGQPELSLGVIPGMGGTQRLTRLVGRAKAMDMILTTRRIGAEEAERIGLVSRVVPADQLSDEAMAVAKAVAKFPAPAVAKAKECVHLVDEATLSTGLRFERSEFWSSFAMQGQQEGMQAFLEKRDPQWTE